MRILAVIAIAATGLVGARGARVAANAARPTAAVDRPYAPSPVAAPIISLGYRETAADLAFVRLTGYFPDPESEPRATAALAETIVALDPMFRRAYELGAIAMTDARRKPDLGLQLQAIDLLERAGRLFPDYYRFPKLAGQIYIGDLETKDPAQRRRWDEKGALLLESASRKPGAPAEMGMLAVHMRTKLGQHQRAIENLQELFLVTTDVRARREILDRLAELQADTGGELAAELLAQRKSFERQWRSDRPAVPPTLYVLIGSRIPPGFDLADLATGGRDLISTETFERLEPLTDVPPPAPPGTP